AIVHVNLHSFPTRRSSHLILRRKGETFMDKLLVIGEIKDGVLRHVSFEAIAAAKKINANGEIVGVLCGSSDLNSQAQEMINYGADHVIVVEHENLEHYTSEGYSQA